MNAHGFTWYDTGNSEALALAREIYREPDAPNILEKANEAIWFVGDKVIKFSDDKEFISNRAKRAQELQGFVPEVDGVRGHMYRYSRVEGRVMSELMTLPLFAQLLEYCKLFWTTKTIIPIATNSFNAVCMKFYRDKTFERVKLFYKNFDRQDDVESINGLPMPKLETLLNAINWEWLAAGDIYYDFSKLLHGLIVSHKLIAGNFYSVEWSAGKIVYDFHRKQILVECERYFERWLEIEGYDKKKVRVLTALIYLNVAALHHYPYSLFLYGLGKDMLAQEMKDTHEN